MDDAVWILSKHIDYEDSDILGVFSTPEKAQDLEHLDEWSGDLYSDGWNFNEDYEFWRIPTTWGSFTIVKWTVD